jgi:hypothetical protein
VELGALHGDRPSDRRAEMIALAESHTAGKLLHTDTLTSILVSKIERRALVGNAANVAHLGAGVAAVRTPAGRREWLTEARVGREEAVTRRRQSKFQQRWSGLAPGRFAAAQRGLPVQFGRGVGRGPVGWLGHATRSSETLQPRQAPGAPCNGRLVKTPVFHGVHPLRSWGPWGMVLLGARDVAHKTKSHHCPLPSCLGDSPDQQPSPRPQIIPPRRAARLCPALQVRTHKHALSRAGSQPRARSDGSLCRMARASGSRYRQR